MEQLIRFLLGNIYFVIVALGILFVLFRKSPLEKPPDGRPGNRPSGRMPDFGGAGLPRPMRPAADPKPAPRPMTAQQPIERREGPAASERRQPPIVTLPARPRSVDAAEEERGAPAGDRQIVYRSPGSPPPTPVPWAGEGESGGEGVPSASAAQAAREDAAYHADANASPLYASAQPQGAVSQARPKHSELARAVMWAEILGPPRSRKPFRR
ncbi:hypothetical protein OMP38_21990 [Cohnella ginsengisoli]|uniref:Uncharacterized protein n=1 Tax=Cohnella ginsengisoli TaxID=425004 RepID=A0A9X4QNF0_9BACL|nr:hypothetical protein [Cohnella ginsengisoli]MDG0793219.1 hypothetical protein [Cohnella ginsengisoli]